MNCDRCGKNIDTDMWMPGVFMLCGACYPKAKLELKGNKGEIDENRN